MAEKDQKTETPPDGDERAALWAEMDAAETGEPVGGDDDAGNEASPTAAASPDEDADGTPGEAEGAAPAAQQPQEPADIWADAPEPQRVAYQALKAERDRLEQYRRSNDGRISAYQREIAELRRSPAQQAKPANGAAPAEAEAADVGEAADDLLGSEDWKTLNEEYPEIAGPLGKVISTLHQKNVRLEKELTAIGDDRRQNALSEQEALLAEVHPDWTEVAADAAIHDWLRSQPRHVREAAQRNGQGIVDAEEAADVVGRFKAWRDAQQAGNGHDAPAAEAGNGRSAPNNAPLSDKRQRQLASAATARSRGPSVAVGIPDDPKGAWDAYERMGL